MYGEKELSELGYDEDSLRLSIFDKIVDITTCSENTRGCLSGCSQSCDPGCSTGCNNCSHTGS